MTNLQIILNRSDLDQPLWNETYDLVNLWLPVFYEMKKAAEASGTYPQAHPVRFMDSIIHEAEEKIWKYENPGRCFDCGELHTECVCS